MHLRRTEKVRYFVLGIVNMRRCMHAWLYLMILITKMEKIDEWRDREYSIGSIIASLSLILLLSVPHVNSFPPYIKRT